MMSTTCSTSHLLTEMGSHLRDCLPMMTSVCVCACVRACMRTCVRVCDYMCKGMRTTVQHVLNVYTLLHDLLSPFKEGSLLQG